MDEQQDSKITVIVGFSGEYDDAELEEDQNLVQDINKERSAYSGVTNPSKESPDQTDNAKSTNDVDEPAQNGKNETKNANTKPELQSDLTDCPEFSPCDLETGSMYSLPFLAGGEQYLPDAFKAITTAGHNLLESFQLLFMKDECITLDDYALGKARNHAVDATGCPTTADERQKELIGKDCAQKKCKGKRQEKPQPMASIQEDNEEAADVDGNIERKPPESKPVDTKPLQEKPSPRTGAEKPKIGNIPGKEQSQDRKGVLKHPPTEVIQEQTWTYPAEPKECGKAENATLSAAEKAEKLARLDRLERLERLEKLERLEQLERLERLERLESCAKEGYAEKPAKRAEQLCKEPDKDGERPRKEEGADSKGQQDDTGIAQIQRDKENEQRKRDAENKAKAAEEAAARKKAIEEVEARRQEEENRKIEEQLRKAKEEARKAEEMARARMGEDDQRRLAEEEEQARKAEERARRAKDDERARRAKQDAEEAAEREEEAARKAEEDARGKEQRRKSEEADAQREEEARRKEQRRKSQEADAQREEEARRKEQRRKSEEADAQREDEVRRKEQRRKSEEAEAKREEEARKKPQRKYENDEDLDVERPGRKHKSVVNIIDVKEERRTSREEKEERLTSREVKEERRASKEEREEERRQSREEKDTRRKSNEENDERRMSREEKDVRRKSNEENDERRKSREEKDVRRKSNEEKDARRISNDKREIARKRQTTKEGSDSDDKEEKRIIVIAEVCAEDDQNRRKSYKRNSTEEDQQYRRKSNKGKEEVEIVKVEQRRRKSDENENVEEKNVELDADARKNVKENRKSLDFVDYFFKKDGFTYIGILTQMKLEYENRMVQALDNASEGIEKTLKHFKPKVDALRKVEPVEKEKEIEEYNYPVVLEKDCGKFDIQAADKIAHITKFHKYALKLVLHWKFLLKEKNELDLLTVYEAATELLAGTMVLCYPIFVRVATFIGTLCDDPRNSANAYPMKYILENMRKMVDTISDEIGAIEESCTLVMKKIPVKNKHEIADVLVKLKAQSLHAKNSLSWAIKAIGAIILHYNLLILMDEGGLYNPVEAKKEKAAASPATLKGEVLADPASKDRSQKDFVDVFFQREGFQYIGVLSKIKMTYEDKCKSELQRATAKLREEAEQLADKLHSMRKVVSPANEKILTEFDFPTVLIKECSEYDMDVTDKLNTIKQFHKYTVKMIEHWSVDMEGKVEVDPQFTYDIGIQLLAGLMALVYPIFVKMAAFVSKLAETPQKSRYEHPPDRMLKKLRKIIEALTDEIGAIGEACMKTVDKVPGITPARAKEIKQNIFSQMLHAKNSVSWGIKSLSPCIFYYFIRVLTDQHRGGGQTNHTTPQKM